MAGGGVVGASPGSPSAARSADTTRGSKGVAMNEGQVVRWDVSEVGLRLRVWAYDETATFRSACELTIPEGLLSQYYEATVNACELARQGHLDLPLY